MSVIVEDADIRRLVSMPDAIEAVRDVYARASAGRVVEADRSTLLLPTGFLRIMAAADLDRGIAGYKEFHRCNGRVRYAYHLFATETGEPLALLDANHLTALRTGACGGLAASLLARDGARVLAVIGSGAEARSQVEAILAVRPIERIQAFSRSAERRERFCIEMRERHGVEVVALADPRAALEGADLVAVATNTGTTGPACLGAWLENRPGIHVNSIGSTLPKQRELDAAVWGQADRIVVDAAIALDESGDAIAGREAGTLDPASVTLLADLVAGRGAGRSDDGDVTLYKSVGSGLQDLAVAVRAFERAVAEGQAVARVPPFQLVAVMDE